MDPIVFEFEGKRYSVPAEAYEERFISLPDGRVLEVSFWFETQPPMPMDLQVFTGVKATEITEAPASN